MAIALSGCGGHADRPFAGYVPVPAGRTAAYHLAAVSPAVSHRAPVDGLGCSRSHGTSYAIHLELYAGRLVVPIPAGIGIAPPQQREGAYVRGGSCTYPIRSFEPTGLVIVDSRRQVTLGTLFALWGQPLSRTRLAGFRGRVSAFVNGARWRQAPEAIPLTPHAQLVLELGREVPPHRTYLFPPGL